MVRQRRQGRHMRVFPIQPCLWCGMTSNWKGSSLLPQRKVPNSGDGTNNTCSVHSQHRSGTSCSCSRWYLDVCHLNRWNSNHKTKIANWFLFFSSDIFCHVEKRHVVYVRSVCRQMHYFIPSEIVSRSQTDRRRDPLKTAWKFYVLHQFWWTRTTENGTTHGVKSGIKIDVECSVHKVTFKIPRTTYYSAPFLRREQIVSCFIYLKWKFQW